MDNVKEDYEKWGNCDLVAKCNNCDFVGNISQLDRITCSKKCGYFTYECDNCSGMNQKVLMKNKLYMAQFKDHVTYTIVDNQQHILIMLCNNCKGDNSDEIIVKNIDMLLNSNFTYTGEAYMYDCIGNQLMPNIKKNDFEYNFQKILG